MNFLQLRFGIPLSWSRMSRLNTVWWCNAAMEALEVLMIMTWPYKPRLESSLSLSCRRHPLRLWRRGATLLYFLTTYIPTGLMQLRFIACTSRCQYAT
ncbi:hypothetical protein EDD18DRAFT_1129014 [Armillaria luteobubalina]|uniref:Uncharacterized protein n=1 Tax=Armillaria luteobubalina TaxID=153913 RepID=A0AA39QLY0_9AGAR|nr:hypothetical protein EDD18DRAFT_1129014 [Armillaria luteobubalina]